MSPQTPEILSSLFKAEGDVATSDLDEVWDAYQRERRAGLEPFRAAVNVARSVDRLGLAFAVGYPAALQHMLPELDAPCALCVTESGGNHPRAIETRLQPASQGYQLDGEKTFVTFGSRAKQLLVAARAGDKPDGRPDIALVRIPADRAGVQLSERPPSPYVPEVPQARLSLNAVHVSEDERLEGDGYLRYIKPFRTIEDIHVLATAAAYLFGLVLRSQGPPELLARLGAQLLSLDALNAADPLDPLTHLALHGAYETLLELLAAKPFIAAWADADPAEHSRWQRDQPLLSVATTAREARFWSAVEALRAEGDG